MVDLDEIARFHHAVISENMCLHDPEITPQAILETLAYYGKKYGTAVVLYGGQTATPLLFRFKNMRTPTGDMDFAVEEPLMEQLVEDEGLTYNLHYHVFYGYCNDVLCVFTGGRVHDWIIPADFFTSSVHFALRETVAAVCAREYTFAMKMRRGFINKSLFGKYAIDIINIITAPYIREELQPMDLKKAVRLTLECTGPSVFSMIEDIKSHARHVPARQRKFTEKEINRLKTFGIKVESVHAPAADVYHTHGDEFINTLETIKKFYGSGVITVHPQRGDRRQARAQYKKIEERIRRLGIVIAYETFEMEHDNRKWITQVEDMHRYFDVLKFPFLGVTYDFTHSQPGKNLIEIRHFHSRIHAIHLSDAGSDQPLDENEKHQHLALGIGDYPVIEFLDVLEKIEYKGFVILEYLPAFRCYLQQDWRLLDAYAREKKAHFLKNLTGADCQNQEYNYSGSPVIGNAEPAGFF